MMAAFSPRTTPRVLTRQEQHWPHLTPLAIIGSMLGHRYQVSLQTPNTTQTHGAKASVPRSANTPMADQPKTTMGANPAKKVGSQIGPQVNDAASRKSPPSQHRPKRCGRVAIRKQGTMPSRTAIPSRSHTVLPKKAVIATEQAIQVGAAVLSLSTTRTPRGATIPAPVEPAAIPSLNNTTSPHRAILPTTKAAILIKTATPRATTPRLENPDRQRNPRRTTLRIQVDDSTGEIQPAPRIRRRQADRARKQVSTTPQESLA